MAKSRNRSRDAKKRAKKKRLAKLRLERKLWGSPSIFEGVDRIREEVEKEDGTR